MTGTANSLHLSGAALPTTRWGIARVEKPFGGNDLHEDESNRQNRRDDFVHRGAPQGLSHSETASAPRWYGSRLSTPFVAQILGQVLAPGELDAHGARAAYEAAGSAFSGRFLDCRL